MAGGLTGMSSLENRKWSMLPAMPLCTLLLQKYPKLIVRLELRLLELQDLKKEN